MNNRTKRWLHVLLLLLLFVAGNYALYYALNDRMFYDQLLIPLIFLVITIIVVIKNFKKYKNN